MRTTAAIWLALMLPETAMAQQVKFERTVIRDPAVGNLEGATLLLPEGWKLEGGFLWMPNFSMQANLLIRVSDPAGGAAVDLLPAQQFNWPTQDLGLPLQPGSNWNGSVLLPPPQSAAAFVQAALTPQTLPHLRDARLVKAVDLPRLAAEAAKQAPPNFKTVSTRLRYAFQVQDKAWEEDVTVTLTFAPLNGFTAMWWCSGFTMRAPAGKLDAAIPLLQVPVQSLRISLAWTARLEEVRKVFTQGLLRSQEDFARFQQSWAQAQKEIQEKHRQVWEERGASRDRQNAAVREILGGIETYQNPFEAKGVELPAGYARHWVSNQGKVVVTNDAAFDPRPGSAEEWRPMERRAP